jgi:hypothetical protein
MRLEYWVLLGSLALAALIALSWWLTDLGDNRVLHGDPKAPTADKSDE